MPVQAVLDSLDGVDDALQPLYEEVGGKYVLQIAGVNQHPEVKNLKSAYEKTKLGLKEAKEALSTFEGVDLDEIAALREKAASGGKPDPEAMEQLRKQIADAARKEYEGTLTKKDQELLSVRSLLERRVIDGDLDAALEKVGVKQAARRIILDHFKARGPKVVAEGDSGPVAMFETDMGPATAAAFVEQWAKSDEAQEFLAPTGKGGSGTPPTGGAPAPAGRVTFDRNDPMAWGKNAEAVMKGEATAR